MLCLCHLCTPPFTKQLAEERIGSVWRILRGSVCCQATIFSIGQVHIDSVLKEGAGVRRLFPLG